MVENRFTIAKGQERGGEASGSPVWKIGDRDDANDLGCTGAPNTGPTESQDGRGVDVRNEVVGRVLVCEGGQREGGREGG